MIFETHNTNPNIDVNMTSLKGYINISFKELVSIFGPSDTGFDDYKSDAEWLIRDPETGVVATIYNYKTGKNYLGDGGLPLEEIEIWNIGGYDSRALTLVKNIITFSRLQRN